MKINLIFSVIVFISLLSFIGFSETEIVIENATENWAFETNNILYCGFGVNGWIDDDYETWCSWDNTNVTEEILVVNYTINPSNISNATWRITYNTYEYSPYRTDIKLYPNDYFYCGWIDNKLQLRMFINASENYGYNIQCQNKANIDDAIYGVWISIYNFTSANAGQVREESLYLYETETTTTTTTTLETTTTTTLLELNVSVYESYFCNGNFSIKNLTYSNLTGFYIQNLTATLCSNGCNENNIMLDKTYCNPNSFTQNVLFLGFIVLLIVGLGKLTKWY